MKNRKIIFVGFILAVVLIPLFIFSLSRLQKNEKPKSEVLSSIIDLPTKKQNRLEEITEKNLLNKEGKYAVVIKNLKTDESYSYNENEKFDTASLYKLWVMAVAFDKIKKGIFNEDEILSAPIVKLNDTLSTTTPTPVPEGFTPSPTPSDQEPERISMRAGDAIEKMITISDNYAALLVASRSGSLSVTNFLKEYGFSDSNFKQPPQTSARDIADFFEKLYNGEIIDSQYSEKMIDILKKQTLNDRIPKYLPKQVEVAHKTGELFNSKHNGGIVFSTRGDYIIVVLSETKDFREAAENIAKYSREIYNYFSD